MSNIIKNLKKEVFSKPVMQIYENRELIAEGCGNVSVYSDEKVIFSSHGRIEIDGKDLVMTNLGRGYVSICGKIVSIRFGEEK